MVPTFFNCYQGLGDALIQTPFLSAALECLGVPLYYCASPVFSFYQEIGFGGMRRLRFLPPSARRVFASLDEAAWKALVCHGIQRVVNLRHDSVRTPEAFRTARRRMNAGGVAVVDLYDSIPGGSLGATHISTWYRSVYETVGVDVAEPVQGWLRRRIPENLVRPAQTDALIVYCVGASTPVKRFPASFWAAVIARVSHEIQLPFVVAGGVSSEEQQLAVEVWALLEQHGGLLRRGRLLQDGRILDVALCIMRSTLVVSGDTYVVHLADLLDADLIALYNATSSTMYGPISEDAVVVQGKYYDQCPLATPYGNCQAWDRGCADMICRREFAAADIARIIRRKLDALRSPLSRNAGSEGRNSVAIQFP